MSWKTIVRGALRRLGYDIVKAGWSGTARRMRLMERYQIDLVLDIGANQGQYATSLRAEGYRGAIVSFEPIANVFTALHAKAKADPHWQTVPLALGDTDGESIIHVSESSVNSSLLPLTERYETLNATTRITREQKINVRRLDSIAAEYIPDNAKVFMKIDTQGFEAHVLRGAAETLKRIHGVQVEMSFVPLYQGETDMLGLLQTMNALGFILMSTEQVYNDAITGRQYQMDGIFFREPMP